MPAVNTSTRPLLPVWEIDPSHTGVHFSIRHLMVANVRGEFGRVSGRIWLDQEDVTRSRIEASIDVASINTRDPQRDNHLRSADFFDVERYPTMEFRSTRITITGEEDLEVEGELTLHGVTRPVTLAVESPATALKDPFGNLKRGASATAKLNRKDFGLEWNMALETGGVMVGDEVKISIDVELVRQAEAA